MAIIHGKVPTPAAPAKAVARVVVSLAVDATVPSAALREDHRAQAISALQQLAPGADFKPYFAGEMEKGASAAAPFDRLLVLEQADTGRALELAWFRLTTAWHGRAG